MSFWQTAAFGVGVFFAGWFFCDAIKHNQFAQAQVALQQSMLQYTADTTKAQKVESDRVIAAVAANGAERAALAGQVSTIIREVERAAASQNCSSSPAIVAALGGLRQLAGPRGPDAEPAP